MRRLLYLSLILWAFDAGISFGLVKNARALEGCEAVASQVERDVRVAEQKAQECDDLLNNLGSLGDGLQPQE